MSDCEVIRCYYDAATSGFEVARNACIVSRMCAMPVAIPWSEAVETELRLLGGVVVRSCPCYVLFRGPNGGWRVNLHAEW